MSGPGRQLDQPLPPHHARVRDIHQKLSLLTNHKLKIPSFHKYNKPFSGGDLQTSKIADHYITGTELYREIKKHYGLLEVNTVRLIYPEHLLGGNQSNSAVSLPCQWMIDNILTRRNIQRLARKKQRVQEIKKLNEEKMCLEKKLQELQLKKKSLRHEFSVSPQNTEDECTLQSRNHSTMENLPKLEVQELLGEMEELMDDYIIHVPQKVQLECEKNKPIKVPEEISFERTVQLIMEQLILEGGKIFQNLDVNLEPLAYLVGKKYGNQATRLIMFIKKLLPRLQFESKGKTVY